MQLHIERLQHAPAKLRALLPGVGLQKAVELVLTYQLLYLADKETGHVAVHSGYTRTQHPVHIYSYC